jgi:hypothetical protein
MPKYDLIDLGFSTADGNRLDWQFLGGNIRFSFVNWREQPVQFSALDVRAFSWLEFQDIPGIRDDVTYEVLESDLIQRYFDCNLMLPKEGYRHFKLCFNEAGVIDVVCRAIAVG